ncbi:PAAR domain-containing protein [Taibaiella koreensis]|uniref:PAAR domain-containing protein n=1 Tax=Taibaiella koreensis TaxID=1268548 RepID=UPI001968D737|nr:PAAR domain-containing protein [Taibaiella koreensis]
MGKPAARITDMHVCPMVTGIVPHVGGPVTGPGVPTVLIGGQPAAVMGDMCTCTGPLDMIALGSAGVLIGGKPAARMGDMTAHGGSIVLGLPTVLIGEAGSGGGGGSTGSGAAGGQGGGNATTTSNALNSRNLKDAAEKGSDLAARNSKEDIQVKYTLIDEADQGIAGAKYEIRTADGAVHNGKTDSSGVTQTLSGYSSAECSITFFRKG